MWEFRKGYTLNNFCHAGGVGEYGGWLASSFWLQCAERGRLFFQKWFIVYTFTFYICYICLGGIHSQLTTAIVLFDEQNWKYLMGMPLLFSSWKQLHLVDICLWLCAALGTGQKYLKNKSNESLKVECIFNYFVLQLIESKWASELSNLKDTQKREYRDWVMTVHEDTQASDGPPDYM